MSCFIYYTGYFTVTPLYSLYHTQSFLGARDIYFDALCVCVLGGWFFMPLKFLILSKFWLHCANDDS